MRRALNEAAREEIQQPLEARGLTHLGVLSRGRYLVIYSEEGGEKVPRLRFGRIDQGRYALDMANHRGCGNPRPSREPSPSCSAWWPSNSLGYWLIFSNIFLWPFF